jgi:hypothetical protein
MSKKTGSAAKGRPNIRPSQRGVRSDRKPPVAAKTAKLADPSACDRCGSVYSGRTWRRNRAVTHFTLSRMSWATCPACEQARTLTAYGRILFEGPYVRENEMAFRRRIANVAARAEHTQPQRRVISAEWDGDTLEVLTTSQKLAHRIVAEIKKAFGGRTSYRWSDGDGTLFATWRR